ncbi:hypothetical protein M422DRAFT_783791 [Sphaerobolus stellatus SS14]|uniref:Uncharacterized protein n=1 Tax=Sphaerobolus stellatus (strain SS14) TaxID=990650 RepID=A0A0C9UQS1_SPHS4|nr:hypothetical protein M422DRAFT_783791 [Sphaerobolus stellatus SS14]
MEEEPTKLQARWRMDRSTTNATEVLYTFLSLITLQPGSVGPPNPLPKAKGEGQTPPFCAWQRCQQLCERRTRRTLRVFPGDICPVYVADINTWKEDFEVREAAIDWEDDELVEFGATTAGSVCFIECGERFAEMSFYRILDMGQPMTALDDDVHELIFDTASPLPVVDIPQVEWTPALDVLSGTAPPNTSVVSSVPHSSRPVIVNRILDSTSSDGAIEEAIVAPVRKRRPVGEPVEQDRHAVKKPKVAGEGTVTANTEMIAVDEKRNIGAVTKNHPRAMKQFGQVPSVERRWLDVRGLSRQRLQRTVGAHRSLVMCGAQKAMAAAAEAANTQQPAVVGDGGAETADNGLQGAVAKGGADINMRRGMLVADRLPYC